MATSTVTNTSPPVAICPVCNGSGICMSCGGVGTMYRPGPPMPWDPWPIDPECLTCEATGNCQRCNGTGAAKRDDDR